MAGDFDPSRRFVRILREPGPDLVEFAFAIGEPDLSMELVLPRAAFDEFCQANRAIFLPPDPATPASDWDWRMSDARLAAGRFQPD